MEKISIITICLNAAIHIENAIVSVIEQSYNSIEYVIIDGGSTDGTIDIINKYLNEIDVFISEPDNGLYHAMNKGIKAASGRLLFFLNSDDRFYDSTVVEEVMGSYKQTHPPADIIYGDVLLENTEINRVAKQPSRLTRKVLARTTICHQAMFARRDLFIRVGLFRESYKVVSDYEWLMRAIYRYNAKSLHIDRNIAIIGTEGITYSTNWKREKKKVLLEYYTPYEIFLWRTYPREIKPRISSFIIIRIYRPLVRLSLLGVSLIKQLVRIAKQLIA